MPVKNLTAPIVTPVVFVGRTTEHAGRLVLMKGQGSGMIRFVWNICLTAAPLAPVLGSTPLLRSGNLSPNFSQYIHDITDDEMSHTSTFRQLPTQRPPELVATIPVGNLPHGIWPSGDGSRVYVSLESGETSAAIDTLRNKVIVNIPIGQTTQTLVYVPGALPDGAGTGNLVPLGEAGNTARLRLASAQTAFPNAQASAAVNLLGLLDLVQIAAEGKAQYQVYLADSDHAPFGKLEPLAVLKTNPDGGGIVQSIGPLKTLVISAAAFTGAPSRRFLVVTELNDSSKVVLRQTVTSTGP